MSKKELTKVNSYLFKRESVTHDTLYIMHKKQNCLLLLITLNNTLYSLFSIII